MNPIAIATEALNPPQARLTGRPGSGRDRRVPAWIAVVLLFSGASEAAWGQSHAGSRGVVAGGSPNPMVIQDLPGPVEFAQTESMASLTHLERQKLWERCNADRQRSVALEIRRLLQLAGELSAGLRDTTQTAPSAEDLRRVEQIQKLARKVKENMAVEPVPQ